MQVSDSARFDTDTTYIFESKESKIVLDNTVGFGSGALSGMSRVYWRVAAVDSAGNRSEWFKGDQFAFVDEDGYVITDFLNAPTFVSGLSHSIRFDEETFVREHVLSWNGGDDDFGTARYEIQVKDSSGKVSYFESSEKEYVLEGVAEGNCSWSVRAVDYTGKVSGWTNGFNFTYDATAPVLDGSSVAGTVYGSDLNITWSSAVDNIEMQGYIVVVQKIGEYGISEEGTVHTYSIFDNYTLYLKDNSGCIESIDVYESESNSHYVSNLLDGNYFCSVYAIDKAGNIGNETAGSFIFIVDTENEPGNSIGSAKEVSWNAGGYANSVGSSSDRNDYYALTLDNAASVTITLRNVDAMNNVKKSRIQVSLLDGKGNVVKSYYVNAGKTNTYSVLLDPADTDYYLRISSGTKNAVMSYVLDAEKVEFPAATDNNTLAAAEEIVLNASGDAAVNGWVGYGDATDCYLFKAIGAGSLNLTVGDVTSSIKVNLYDAESGKKLKTLSVSSGSKTLSNVLVPGDVYVEVVSGDKGKGKKNSNYSLTVDNSYFPATSDDNNFNTAQTIMLDSDGDAFINGWVGYGDATDCYLLESAGAGSLNLIVSDVTSSIKVNLYDAESGKKLKTLSVSSGSKTLSNVLVPGDVYVEVVSGDKGKGKKNSNYSLTVDNSYFPAASDDNTLQTAQFVSLDVNGDAVTSGWVGYGDAVDCYKLNGVGNGLLSVTVSDVSAKVTVNLYDSNMKKLKSVAIASGSKTIDNILVSGASYLEVVSGDKGKGKFNTSFNVQVDEEYFPTPTDNNDAASATLLTFVGDQIDQSGWVGFGDVCDYYRFELTSACKVDLNLVSADMKVGSQLKIALYDAETGKKLSMNSDYISKSVLDAGSYMVSVTSANQKKYYGNYDLSIAQIA